MRQNKQPESSIYSLSAATIQVPLPVINYASKVLKHYTTSEKVATSQYIGEQVLNIAPASNILIPFPDIKYAPKVFRH